MSVFATLHKLKFELRTLWKTCGEAGAQWQGEANAGRATIFAAVSDARGQGSSGLIALEVVESAQRCAEPQIWPPQRWLSYSSTDGGRMS